MDKSVMVNIHNNPTPKVEVSQDQKEWREILLGPPFETLRRGGVMNGDFGRDLFKKETKMKIGTFFAVTRYGKKQTQHDNTVFECVEDTPFGIYAKALNEHPLGDTKTIMLKKDTWNFHELTLTQKARILGQPLPEVEHKIKIELIVKATTLEEAQKYVEQSLTDRQIQVVGK